MTSDTPKPAVTSETTTAIDLPRRPVPLTHAQRIAVFGRFAYTHNPLPPHGPNPAKHIAASLGDPEHVAIAESWEREHIVTVRIEPYGNRFARVHKLIADQFLGLWDDWAVAGKLGLVITFNGAHVSRYKRQKGTFDQRVAKCRELGERALSNHAWGTAFDINSKWNPLGEPPAPIGAKGSVVELVPYALRRGFVWGGDFESRPDGMHFEAFKVQG